MELARPVSQADFEGAMKRVGPSITRGSEVAVSPGEQSKREFALQYAVCSMQYAVCSMQYAVCSMQYAVCSMQYAVCSAQCAVPSLQCAVCSMQYAGQSSVSKLFGSQSDVMREQRIASCLYRNLLEQWHQQHTC